MQIILEIIFIAISELIIEIFGIRFRYIILKLFNPKLNFEEFSQNESGWHKFYNAVVGLLILIGLIFGVAFLYFN
ncbi:MULTISPECIES: hypothetical protein [Empedobacter]|uniref:Uncharacterized protein n=1 Tax=Empedobacter falsenii TaxID=343874 RepID=A0A7H9DXE9_9FLAO|nr:MULTISPECIES: hypothetical protein [Empedobacter]MBY0065940.1 hypothetical protein [Empedobacter falsenii]MDH2207126.1 hypothetical protein [Empedobacter sp. GD03644]QLL59409.1 hypothetical protein FH779_15545 [Empedobacter falsenii]